MTNPFDCKPKTMSGFVRELQRSATSAKNSAATVGKKKKFVVEPREFRVYQKATPNVFTQPTPDREN